MDEVAGKHSMTLRLKQWVAASSDQQMLSRYRTASQDSICRATIC
jgi:hypothetical protein